MGLAVRFGRRPEGLTLAEYFRRCGQGAAARRLLWDPLALAVLNEPVERAAAVLFHRVYQEAFLRDRRASRLVFLRRGLGGALERLARVLRGARRHREAGGAGRGDPGRGRARDRRALRPAGRDAGGGGGGAAARGARRAADAVVSAVPAHALRGLLPEEWRARGPFAALARFGSSPIVSVEMWLDRVVVDRPMLGLRDSEMEWVFDKGRLYGREGAPQHLAFIVSAAYRSASKTQRRARRRGRGRARAATSRRWRGRPSSARSCCASRSPRSRRARSSRRCVRGRTRRSRASSSPATGRTRVSPRRSRARCAAGSARRSTPGPSRPGHRREREAPRLPAAAVGGRGLPRGLRAGLRPRLRPRELPLPVQPLGDPGRRRPVDVRPPAAALQPGGGDPARRRGLDPRSRLPAPHRQPLHRRDRVHVDPQWPLFTRLLSLYHGGAPGPAGPHPPADRVRPPRATGSSPGSRSAACRSDAPSAPSRTSTTPTSSRSSSEPGAARPRRPRRSPASWCSSAYPLTHLLLLRLCPRR